MMVRRLLRPVSVVLLTGFTFACAGGDQQQPTEPDEPEPHVTTIEVTPSSAELNAIGATQDFEAEAKDQNGNTMSGVSFSWSVSPDSVGTVDSDGTVTAEVEGTATVEASASGVTGSADLTVVAEVADLTISPDSVTLTVLADTQQFEATAMDTNGNPVSDPDINWSSSDSDVLVVGARGAAVGQDGGRASVVASAAGVADTAQVISQVVLTGEVLSPTGEPVSSTFRLEADTASRSAETDGEGRFRLDTTLPVVGDTSVVLSVVPGSDSDWYPSQRRYVPLDPLQELNAVLFPREWTVRSGNNAGQRLSVAPEFPWSYPNRMGYYQNWLGSSYASWWDFRHFRSGDPVEENFRARSIAWPRDSFPVPVYFAPDTVMVDDREVLSVTRQDSLDFWSAANAMEEQLGRDLFRPARQEDLAGPDAMPNSTFQPGRQPAFSIEVFKVENGSLPKIGQGVAFRAGLADQSLRDQLEPHQYVYGQVEMEEQGFGDKYLTNHELLHALGAAHTCFPSLMRSCSGSYAYQDLPTDGEDDQPGGEPTVWDDAFWEILTRMHETVIAQEAAFGPVQALQGYRVITQEKAPVRRCWIAPGLCPDS